jgi:tripartite-type tricarboxylate transporter receptor subunit TctC
MINAKRLNPLAIASGKRIGVLPEVPTVAESGFPGFDVATTYGIFAPSGTPVAVVKLLNAQIRKVVQMEDIKVKFAEQGMEAAASTPEEWRAMVAAETAQWARVIKDAHITVN